MKGKNKQWLKLGTLKKEMKDEMKMFIERKP